VSEPNIQNGRWENDAIFAGATFVVTILALSFEWTNGLAGGISSVGAERVLAGEVPYSDFWTMYAPGHYYLLSVVYYIFGTHLIVEIIAGTVATAAGASSLFLLARKCGGGTILSLGSVAVFLAAMFNTEYYKYPGSYPTSIFLILTGLNFLALYFRDKRRRCLVLTGIFVGAAIVFKHDVGIYTTIFSTLGIITFSTLRRLEEDPRGSFFAFVPQLLVYYSTIGVIAIPVYGIFLAVAGSDMVRDLLIFPLTDFPFSRPEIYPGLIPRSIRGGTQLKTAVNFFYYLSFTVPFMLFLCGLVAGVLAYRKRQAVGFALAVIFCAAFLLHYRAAHVQINTHIISLSIYGSLLGILFYSIFTSSVDRLRVYVRRLAASALGFVWLAALMAAPAYSRYLKSGVEMEVLRIEKVDGLSIEADEARNLTELSNLVNEIVPRGEPIYAGLNRHDALLIGDARLYFILDRPSATRYHELHPAITDTRPIQLEMINGITRKNVRLIVRKHIFSDEEVDKIKADFLKTLPNIGATEMDDHIRDQFFEYRRFGKYAVWLRKGSEISLGP
jgi:hypothetical protein